MQQQMDAFGRGVALHKNHLSIPQAYFWVAFGLAWLMMGFPPFRYLFLVMPVLLILLLVVERGGSMPDEIWPFMIIAVATVVLWPLNEKEGVKDVYLMFSGITIAFVRERPRVTLWTITLVLVSSFVFLYGLFGNLKGGIRWDPMNSVSSFEGSFSFIFALIVPFAFMRKRYMLALFALALCLLTLKRIAIAAALMSVVLIALGDRRTRWLLNWRLMIPLNMVALVFVGMYVRGDFDALVWEWTHQSANQFAQGRVALQMQVYRGIEDKPWEFILGKGAGTVYHLTSWGESEGQKRLLHNDSLKLLYEYGAVVWLLFFWALYRSKSFAVRVSGALLNVMLLTDNLLSYNFFIYYYLIILGAFYQEEGKTAGT